MSALVRKDLFAVYTRSLTHGSALNRLSKHIWAAAGSSKSEADRNSRRFRRCACRVSCELTALQLSWILQRCGCIRGGGRFGASQCEWCRTDSIIVRSNSVLICCFVAELSRPILDVYYSETQCLLCCSSWYSKKYDVCGKKVASLVVHLLACQRCQFNLANVGGADRSFKCSCAASQDQNYG